MIDPIIVIIYGAIASGTLALLALGFTLIYGVADVVNMAHGAFFMLGAYSFLALTSSTTRLPFEPIQLDLRLALILAVIFVGIVGSIVYRLTIHPVKDDMVAALVVTIGVSFIVQHLIAGIFKDYRMSVETFVSGYTRIFGVKVFQSRLLAFLVSLALFAGLWVFITKSKIGTAMRAVAQDREVAMLMGINTERLCMLTMAISSSLAAIAGILTSAYVIPQMWMAPLYMSFAIVILGGLGSIKGTLVGAFIIGYTEEIFANLAPEVEFLGGAVALAVMVAVLLLRPKGLFGKRIELEE